MIEIEDMPIPMQGYMVGLPRTWVRLFRRLGRVVRDYNRAHRPWTVIVDFYVPRALLCIIFFEGISPSDSWWLPLLRHLCPSMYSETFFEMYIYDFYFFYVSLWILRMKMYLHVFDHDLLYVWARCQSKMWLARVSVIFRLLGTWKYVI